MNPFSGSQQHGFAALAAIFLIVCLGTLGTIMLMVSNTQQLDLVRDVQSSRAYWAAQGGLEWAIASVAASVPVAPATEPMPHCPVAASPAQLDGFGLVVRCTRRTYDEAGTSVNIFELTSVASTPNKVVGSQGFVERSVSVLIER